MAIKTFKPYTPARRNMTVSAFEGVDKKAKPERSLVESLKKNSGRNSYATLIVKGKKTIDQVPSLIRKQVEEILADLEVTV